MEGNSSYSYQSSGGASGGSDFHHLSQTIGSNIQKISQNVSSIQRMINQLGAPQDSQQLRNQLHQIQHYTNQLAKDTNRLHSELQNMPLPAAISEQRQWKLQKKRLMEDFSAVLNNFQTAQRIAAEKERSEVKKARAHSNANFFEEATSPDPLISLDRRDPNQTQLMMEEEVNMAQLQEREQAIQQLESDIMDVNQIFKDLGTLVHEQGEIVDSIEANVESSHMRVSEGTQQLSKAMDYQNKARRKKVIIFIILVVVLAIVISIIAWQSS